MLYVIAKESRCETNKCTCFSLKFADLCNSRSCSNVNTDEDAEATEKDDYKNCDDDDWEDMTDDEEDLLDNGDIWLGSKFLVKRNFLFIKSDFVLLQRYLC